MISHQTPLETSNCNLTFYEKVVRLRNAMTKNPPIDQEVLKNEIIKYGFHETRVDVFQSIIQSEEPTWCLILLLIKHLGDDDSECWNILCALFRAPLSLDQKKEVMEYILSFEYLSQISPSITEQIKTIKERIRFIKQQVEKHLNVKRWKEVKSKAPDVAKRLALLKCGLIIERPVEELLNVVLNGLKRKRGRPSKVNPFFIRSPPEDKKPQKTRPRTMHKKMKLTHSTETPSPIPTQTSRNTPIIQPHDQNIQQLITVVNCELDNSPPVHQTHEQNNEPLSPPHKQNNEPLNPPHEQNNEPLNPPYEQNNEPLSPPFEQKNEPDEQQIHQLSVNAVKNEPDNQTHETVNHIVKHEPLNTTHEQNNQLILDHTTQEPTNVLRISYNGLIVSVPYTHSQDAIEIIKSCFSNNSINNPILVQQSLSSNNSINNPILVQQLFNDFNSLKTKVSDDFKTLHNRIEIIDKTANVNETLRVVLHKVEKIDKDVADQTSFVKSNDFITRSKWNDIDRKLDAASKSGIIGTQNQSTNGLSQREFNRPHVSPFYINPARVSVQ